MADEHDEGDVARLVALGKGDGDAEAKARAMLANERLRAALDDAKTKGAAADAPRPAPASEMQVGAAINVPTARGSAGSVASGPRVMVAPRGAALQDTTEVIGRPAYRGSAPAWSLAIAAALGVVVGTTVTAVVTLGSGSEVARATPPSSAAVPATSAGVCPPAPEPLPCEPATAPAAPTDKPTATPLPPSSGPAPATRPPPRPPTLPHRPAAPPSTTSPVLE